MKSTLKAITFKSFMRRKREVFLVILFAVLAFALISATIIMQDNIYNIQQEETYNIYGEWHFGIFNTTDDAYDFVKDNALIEEIGKMESYGEIYDDKGESSIGTLGTIDEKALSLGRIELREGKLPEDAEEIAMEAHILSKLGYSYELGQTITLTLLDRSKEYSSKEEMQFIQKEYILCGVIESYQFNFLSGGALVTAVISESGAKEYGERQALQVFSKVIQGYDSKAVMDDLLKAWQIDEINENEQWLWNSYGYDKQDNYISMVSILVMLSIFAIAMIYSTFLMYLKRRKIKLSILRVLGMKKENVRAMLVIEGLSILIIGVSIGVLFGILVSYTGLMFYNKVVSKEMHYSLSYWSIGLALLLGFIASGIGLILPMITFGKVSILQEMKDQGRNKKIGIKTKNRDKKSTLLWLVCRNMRIHKLRTFLQIITVTGTLSMVGICIYNIYISYNEYKFNKGITPYDYQIGVKYDDLDIGETPISLSADALEGIEKIYGIGEVEAYRWTNEYSIDWEGRLESEFYSKTVEFNAFMLETVWVDYISVEKNRIYAGIDAYIDYQDLSEKQKTAIQEKYNRENITDVVEVDLEKDIYKSIIKSIDEGTLDKERFQKGEEIILFLPMRAYHYEYGGEYIDFGYGELPSDSLTFYSEDKIHVGDKVMISSDKEVKSVKVGAIIRSFESTSMIKKLSNIPYTVLCSHEFYSGLDSISTKEDYNVAYITATSQADYLSTDKLLSIIVAESPNQRFSNIRELMDSKLLEAVRVSLLAGILMTLILSLSCMLQVNRTITELDINRKRIGVFRALGMEVTKIRLVFILENLTYVIAGYLLSCIILITYMYLISESGAYYVASINSVVKYFFKGAYWYYYIGALVVYTAIRLMIIFLPINRILKNSIVENIREIK